MKNKTSQTSTLAQPTALTLRGPHDLAALGPFLKARRRAAGFRSAREAAPHLGVTTRLLVEVERGERTKRGITLGKLLAVLQQLGYVLELHPRDSAITGRAEITLAPITLKATGVVEGPPKGTKKGTKGKPRRPLARGEEEPG